MKSLRAMTLVLSMALSAAPAAVALAQDEAHEEDAAESRAATFEAARGAQTEDVPGGALLISAYGVVLVLLLGYVVSIGFRQARTAQELERLRHDMKAQGREAPSGGPPPEEL